MKNLKPITREETMLAKAAGQDVPTLEPVTREEFFLADVIEAIESGGLPAVTSDDNGNVLTVVDGAWAKAVPSGGGGCLYVTFSTEDEGTTWTADKTFAECLEAYAYGSAVIARWNYEGALGIANLSGFDGLGTVGSPISEMYFKYLTYFTNAFAGYNFKVFSFVLTNEDAVRYHADEFTIISASQ